MVMEDTDILNQINKLPEPERARALVTYARSIPDYEELGKLIVAYPELLGYIYQYDKAYFREVMTNVPDTYTTSFEATSIIANYVDVKDIVLNEKNVSFLIENDKIRDRLITERREELLHYLRRDGYSFLFGEHAIKFVVEDIKNDNNFVLDGHNEVLGSFEHMEIKKTKMEQSYKNNPLVTLGYCATRMLDMEDVVSMAQILIKNSASLPCGIKFRNAMAQAFNKNPELLREILEKDYRAGLCILQVCDVTKLSKEAIDYIKKMAQKNKYVVGYVNNNPYLINELFMISLRNDFDATMNHGMHASRTFIYKHLSENQQEIEERMSSRLASANYKIPEMMKLFIEEDNEILFKALEKNYARTIENLGRNPEEIKLSAESQKRLYDILIKNNFVIKSGSAHYWVNPMFLVASMRNDYETTRSFIINIKKTNSVNFTEEEFNLIYQECFKRKDNELMKILVGTQPNIFCKMLGKKPLAALSALENNLGGSDFIFDEKSARFVIDELIKVDKIENIDFSRYPNVLRMLSWAINKDDNVDKKYRDFLIEKGLSVSYMPISKLESIAPYLKNQEELNLYRKIYFNPDYEYSKEDEAALLRILGSKYDSIEDELASMQHSQLRRQDLSPMQLLAIVLFAKKDQHKKGIKGCKVNVYGYSQNPRGLGQYSYDKNSLNLYNGHNQTIYGLLKTIIHENNHARQRMDTKNSSATKDSDILSYSKDYFLRDVLADIYGVDYYRDNYSRISTEFDTELKAQMEALSILRMEEKHLGDGEVDPEDLVEFSEKNNKYTLDGKRNFAGKEYYLDELFEMGLNEALKRGVYTVEEIREKYPTIDDEYDLSVIPVKKIPMEELLEKYNNGDEEQKALIESIIRNRVNPIYQRDYEKNLDEFILLTQKYGYESDIVKVAIKILEELKDSAVDTIDNTNVTMSKYLKIAENILANREKRISDEEFKSKAGR